MKKVIILFVIFLSLFCGAQEDIKPQDNYLYSAEYFNNLIYAAEICREQRYKELHDEIVENNLEQEEEILSEEDTAPFHLRIEQGIQAPLYKDSFKKIDSKTIIPISDKFSFIQDTSKTRSKYNSQDYKILAGAEYQPVNF